MGDEAAVAEAGDVEAAYAVLRRFIGDMQQWEVTYWQALAEAGRGAVKTDMKRDLDTIFETFCTRKERKAGRQVALNCANPPEYHVEEKFVAGALVKKSVVIETLQHHILANRFRYTLRLQDGQWKLDRKERYDSFDAKWDKVEL